MVGIPGRGTTRNEWEMQKCETWKKLSKFSLYISQTPPLLCRQPATHCRTDSSYNSFWPYSLMSFLPGLLALWVVEVQGASFILCQLMWLYISDTTAGTQYLTELTLNVSLDRPSLRSISKLPIPAISNVVGEVRVETKSSHNLTVFKIFFSFFAFLSKIDDHTDILLRVLSRAFEKCLCKWGSLELGFISFMVCVGKSFIPCNFSNVSTISVSVIFLFMHIL